MQVKEKPYVLFVAEEIYLAICEIKKKNPSLSNIDAVESFIGSEKCKKISSGQFHDKWFDQLKKMILLTNQLKRKFLKKQ